MDIKPGRIAGPLIWAICIGGVGAFVLLVAEMSRSTFQPELGAADLLAWALLLASAVFGAVSTWRLAVAIDWLVTHRHAEFTARFGVRQP